MATDNEKREAALAKAKTVAKDCDLEDWTTCQIVVVAEALLAWGQHERGEAVWECVRFIRQSVSSEAAEQLDAELRRRRREADGE